MIQIPTDDEMVLGMSYQTSSTTSYQNFNGVKTPTVLYQGSDAMLNSLEFYEDKNHNKKEKEELDQEKIGEHLMIIKNGRAHQRNQYN